MTRHLDWKKSSYSGDNGGECVETAHLDATVLVRDSKRPDGPRLGFRAGVWSEFVQNGR
ncbi:DUF397 domain-containing protein [Yinghuangia seranimata]|uniref:DUF397 domain-containing protein n=1 Tax=Yinghuangia seranimata TaxID=408067 RepID=UPI00248B9E70|nr:DUF397 domain-containing protein [Yinghuangia seranimata]MDI2129992.1 DUF397 domain-containing protein [Yinghuangia seranimata]